MTAHYQNALHQQALSCEKSTTLGLPKLNLSELHLSEMHLDTPTLFGVHFMFIAALGRER
jgi:hypothetical protein